ncbi:EscE/YscE/SsaE family type III secretion system needle protein co-chaperone [Pandoraea fibrosis]|uniref:EscE/YscE/SsaE family type III secretion system needle protein co-chaperone n=1 Tax=Pandoraea fibrosis TaxID=1891094 RepID=A0ABX6HMB1_9BURK|nr:EscE/YscE/SsaE family type III secretion system needle protein co-chaperone [Pandoraea fibrosis]QHE91122.1 EscE/YscE/SsaE family type III secretion system needle protein co-chaperone [Pandoraea fibrosis]QHF11953.1 EscE/YscE/SsaE family type III secretion system needle protein co-chaperone [Pandoraea fibrosis]
MVIRLTQLEDQLAASPGPVAREVGAQLDTARQSLQQALREPLPPAEHALAQTQMQAVQAAHAILERMAQRYDTSYGRSS